MENILNNANKARKFSAKDREAIEKRRDTLNCWALICALLGGLCFPPCGLSGWFAIGFFGFPLVGVKLLIEADKYDDML